MPVPDLPGVLTADEIRRSAEWIVSLQLESGMIPWFPGGHCDPWNHVETAMALDIAGFSAEAVRAYEWLASVQRPEGAWHNYYLPDGHLEDAKLDTNVTAYIAAGVWHHWLCTGDRAFVDAMWPTVRRALDWVVAMRRPDGTILWAREIDESPWDYALLTGSSSIWHALECGQKLAALVDDHPLVWDRTADNLRHALRHRPDAFEPKDRWAMDWYYPVLAGAVDGVAGRARLDEGWAAFVMDGLGVRCVSDEPWITASETSEASIAYSAIGDVATATDLLRWTRTHRLADGSYYTGLVYPEGSTGADLAQLSAVERVTFPDNERSAYTGAAVILAADAIANATPAGKLFAL